MRRLYELGYNIKVIARRPEKIKARLERDGMQVTEGTRPLEMRRVPQGDMRDKVTQAGIMAAEDVHSEYVGRLSTVHLELCRTNIRQPTIREAVADCDAVVNLVGILYESKLGGTFQAVHADSAARVAASAQQASIQRLVHVSAIGASEESPSEYARSKAFGEKAILHYCPTATILRPSIVVGRGDGFFSFFDRMARISPFLPLVDGGKAKFQPVHVDDLVEAVACALVKKEARGQTYEIGGPQIYTFEELLRKLLAYRKRYRVCLPLPVSLADMVAMVSENLPFPPLLTRDQIKQLQRDNVVSSEAKTLADLGVRDLLTVEEALKDIFEEQ